MRQPIIKYFINAVEASKDRVISNLLHQKQHKLYCEVASAVQNEFKEEQVILELRKVFYNTNIRYNVRTAVNHPSNELHRMMFRSINISFKEGIPLLCKGDNEVVQI